MAFPPPVFRAEMHWCRLPARASFGGLKCPKCGTYWWYDRRSDGEWTWQQHDMYDDRGRKWSQPRANGFVVTEMPARRWWHRPRRVTVATRR